MKRYLRFLPFIIAFLFFNCIVKAQFTQKIVNPAYQLDAPWAILWGPDDSLWVTESHSYKVDRINVNDGNQSTLIDLSSQRDFNASVPVWPQGGLMGMVLHPSMYTEWPAPSKPWIYLAYVYHYASTLGACATGGECYFKTRIVRYDYTRSSHSLNNPRIIIESLNGSNDHNSGRLTIGRMNGIDYLFYTIGDMGAGQFNNISRPNKAQTRDSLEGKVLRFNLDSSGQGSWIPPNNPYTDANGKKTAVWTWGHRNAQGIVMASNGILYNCEHGDKSDDEVNILDSSRNYGWPKVSGYCDGNYNGLTLANQPVGNEQNNCTNLNAVEPIYTLFTSANPGTLGTNNLTWPTVAPSSINYYNKPGGIAGWNHCLLITTLKAGKVYKLHLDPSGTSILDSVSIPEMRGVGRFRDICFNPIGNKIYLACDLSGQTSGPSGGFNGGGTPPPNAGRILEFTYTGALLELPEENLYVRDKKLYFKIFPNPVSSILTVESKRNISKPIHYMISDIEGKHLIEGYSRIDRFEINMTSFSRGLYFIHLYNGYDISMGAYKIMVK